MTSTFTPAEPGPIPLAMRETFAKVADAAGRGHVLMIGRPGSGGVLFARHLRAALPGPVSFTDRWSTAVAYSSCGAAPAGAPLRAPHHTVSIPGLLGRARRGTPVCAGEVTLAHCGILLLDELHEFSRAAIEGLSVILDDRRVTFYRGTLPAAFTLVGYMPPCPCGFLGDPVRASNGSQPAATSQRFSLPLE